MNKKSFNCVCNNNVTKLWDSVQKTTYSIYKCDKCGILVCDRILDNKIENIYVDDDLYHIKEQIKIGHIPYKDRFNNDYTVAVSRIKRFKELLSLKIEGKKILDIGCSNGSFLKCCSDNGALVNGIEPNKNIAEFANLKLKEIFEKDSTQFINVNLLEDSSLNFLFDYVFMHDVIEHLTNPKLSLHIIKDIIKNKGVLVIDTPNTNSESFKKDNQNWKHIRPLEHLWYFNPEQLLNVLNEFNFKLICVDYPIEGKFVMYCYNESIF